MSFIVCAGYYPAGVTVSTFVAFSGYISHEGDLTQVPIYFSARFGSMQVDFSRESSFDDNLYMDYLLTQKIVPNYSDLTKTAEYQVPVMGWLNIGTVTGGGPGHRYAEADFSHSASFLSIETPPGVTWRSESGVFLSQPIPLPSTMLLLGSGLLGLAGWRRFRKG